MIFEIVLDVLVKVKLPAPIKFKSVAVIAAVCVTAPVACNETLLLVAVKAPLMAIAPPKTDIGPLAVIGLEIVMFVVFVDFPILTLDGLPVKVNPPKFIKSKDEDKGSKTKAPEVLNSILLVGFMGLLFKVVVSTKNLSDWIVIGEELLATLLPSAPNIKFDVDVGRK